VKEEYYKSKDATVRQQQELNCVVIHMAGAHEYSTNRWVEA
jgi:hypothetical protein